MKKLLITLLSLMLLLALLFVGSVVYSYYTTDEGVVPRVDVSVAGTSLPADSYYWSQPLLGGITRREFERAYANDCVSLGEMEGDTAPLGVPEGYGSLVTVSHRDGNGKELSDFQGSAQEYKGFSFPESGEYFIDVNLSKPEEAGGGYGRFHFRASLTIRLAPVLLHTETTVAQGDVFAIELQNVPEGVVPTAESEVSQITFARQGESWIACVPVSYMREPGSCSVTVRCGEEINEELSFEVVEGEFEVQNLTIDTSPVTSPEIAEASSPAAYAQYRAAIYPLYEQADQEIHWSGSFTEPVEGYRISTPYGVKRYTNGAKTPSRHAGVDMAVGKGTPVKAPAAGRVVFAQYLLNTGNTVAIEHGAGLKTFYFHMDSLGVSEGDMVEQGQQIGEVGTTGYSTGPHLHFEMRIANQAVDPFLMFEGKGGLYRLP